MRRRSAGLSDALAGYWDMDAAVELGMLHLDSTLGDVPILVVGYLNGGAPLIHYTAGAIVDKTLPLPDFLLVLL